ncbi:MAG: hypothetical protein HGA38_05070 [Candidatus Moranbacteria bacterium]|nr:hypothetical protein [Candidatus Moranbacteria bacterium]
MLPKSFRALARGGARIFCDGMTCPRHIGRDVFVTLTFALGAVGFLYSAGSIGIGKPGAADVSGDTAGSGATAMLLSEEDVVAEVERIVAPVDTGSWKPYRNDYYGFELRYPAGWQTPSGQIAPRGSKWEYRFRFRKPVPAGGTYVGFDVVVYDVAKAKELSGTDEYPALRNEEAKGTERCATIDRYVVDAGDYPLSEVYVPPGDDCYRPTLFLSLVRDRYIYDVVPITGESAVSGPDPRASINMDLPELYSVGSSFRLIDIVRPKPVPPKPRITAPHPVSYKKVNGRLVCAKKHDHPSKSGKGKHLDMECCLDPDEYPNPWCYYPPEKYGKYL